ncbi:hypothetical protein FS749_014825 [Ceratobasidium sp. UAMH 11750]|nr:hypothetical protein FS749_014825 [Ceratobasidium sp. UAMH 11750]
MASSSNSSVSPSPAVPCQLESPSVRQFHLAETWLMGGRDFELDHMLEEYGAHLAGLVQGQQGGPYPVRKLPKKRRRPATDHSNTPSVHAPRTRAITLRSRLPLAQANPEPKPVYEPMNLEYEDLDSLFLEAGRLASLEHVAIERGMLDGVILRSHSPATSNRPHLEASRMARSRSSTPPADYNAHGCLTARSKGKGRAD